jgi:hypothetical protein
LKEVPMTAKDIKKYEETMDKVNYNNNDC